MAAELPPVTGRFFEEVTNEFKTMRTTRYQHKTEVDRAVGSYQYDCVGFVSYALRQSAPQAWASVVSACGIRKGYFPSPPRYQRFFAGLAETPQLGWQAIAKVSELRPGDIISWDHKTETAVGHAVVIASIPSPEPDGVWVVEVYDSTSAPHLEDSRSGDSRAQAMELGGRRSGLGHGVMALIADPRKWCADWPSLEPEGQDNHRTDRCGAAYLVVICRRTATTRLLSRNELEEPIAR